MTALLQSGFARQDKGPVPISIKMNSIYIMPINLIKAPIESWKFRTGKSMSSISVPPLPNFPVSHSGWGSIWPSRQCTSVSYQRTSAR